ncbi:MAG: bifunctional 5,10-methylenetetrahydrofolate dehydrogenase/5,10-methenyltetrahydrofolate cyclohydrolase [candidate division WWE3 bacterium]|nr:bifunctional 5,10-methylenetetrahydrofolate dehydrogenase/5,10-methenyltetrahydrofolate cyclohydrolase [candidate division WWE3 bacterium]
MIIFDGKALASQIELDIKNKFTSPKQVSPERSGGERSVGGLNLVILATTTDEASNTYVRMKQRLGERLGVTVQKVTVTAETLSDELKKYAAMTEVTGLMVQLPIPSLDKKSLNNVLSLIPLTKDVDGLNPQNLALIKTGQQTFLPATVLAVERIIAAAPLEFKLGLTTAAVVGANGMVGGPLSDRLEYLGFKVGRFDIGETLTELRDFDVVVSCTGSPKLITSELIKPGAIVIDVGYPQGDVDFENVKNKTSFITPVPGGVGPVTVASLMENLVQLCHSGPRRGAFGS